MRTPLRGLVAVAAVITMVAVGLAAIAAFDAGAAPGDTQPPEGCTDVSPETGGVVYSCTQDAGLLRLHLGTSDYFRFEPVAGAPPHPGDQHRLRLPSDPGRLPPTGDPDARAVRIALVGSDGTASASRSRTRERANRVARSTRPAPNGQSLILSLGSGIGVDGALVDWAEIDFERKYDGVIRAEFFAGGPQGTPDRPAPPRLLAHAQRLRTGLRRSVTTSGSTPRTRRAASPRPGRSTRSSSGSTPLGSSRQEGGVLPRGWRRRHRTGTGRLDPGGEPQGLDLPRGHPGADHLRRRRSTATTPTPSRCRAIRRAPRRAPPSPVWRTRTAPTARSFRTPSTPGSTPRPVEQTVDFVVGLTGQETAEFEWLLEWDPEPATYPIANTTTIDFGDGRQPAAMVRRHVRPGRGSRPTCGWPTSCPSPGWAAASPTRRPPWSAAKRRSPRCSCSATTRGCPARPHALSTSEAGGRAPRRDSSSPASCSASGSSPATLARADRSIARS